MLKNYIKIAWRNLLRNKSFSAINIFGLAIGLAVFFLISLFVLDELQYDRHNKNANRIYRINIDLKINGSRFNDHSTPAPMAVTLAKTYPQIEQAVRIDGGGSILIKKGNETLLEQDAFFADPSLFDVFTLPMLAGDPKTALSQPNTMVISASMAQKYFKTIDVVGKMLKIDNSFLYKITGVIEDVPAQSHLHFNFIRSLSSQASSNSDFWLSNSFDTYVLLREGTSQRTLDQYLRETAKKYTEPQLLNVAHSSFSDLEKKGEYFKYTSIPLTKIHLHSTLPSEIEPTGNIQYVYIFSVIALFILLIACVNFMNLSTARSANRSKEVGIRKVIGSDRFNLIKQFLTESVLTSLLAFLFAFLLSACLLPYLNQLSGKEISLNATTIWLVPFLALIAVFTGLLAGSYPAFFLSSFNPVDTLKGKLALGFKGSRFRDILVIFQFTTAIILIAGTLIIYSQLNYIQDKNVGYTREQVLVIKNAYALDKHAKTFKDEVLQLPGVLAGSRSGTLPTSSANDWNKNAYSIDATMSANKTKTLIDWDVDADYISTLAMQIVKGRNFSSQMATDSNAVIINETAARLLAYKDPINAKLYGFNSEAKEVATYNIVGVVKDFNAGSLRYETEPMVLRLSKYGGQFSFRIKSENIQQTIEQIKSKYHSFEGMSDQPFLFSFLDDEFNRLYHNEQRTGKIFISFSTLVIFIACLGLFGLASYAAEQRTKEIGIRKVLGASVNGIVQLLSKDFIRLVFVAIVIASPIAWWAMNKWLEDFANHIDIDWWVFASAGLVAIVIALFTVSFQAIKAALANPVKSLRSE
jgi:putative ABC transport system permease protein